MVSRMVASAHSSRRPTLVGRGSLPVRTQALTVGLLTRSKALTSSVVRKTNAGVEGQVGSVGDILGDVSSGDGRRLEAPAAVYL
jgi:hypothetical protein